VRGVTGALDCLFNPGERNTVPADLMPLTNVIGIRKCLAEIAAGNEETARFFSDVFARLESLWSELGERENELARRQSAWRAEREEIEGSFRSRSAELERERDSLARERQEIRERAEEGRPNGSSASDRPTEEIQRLEAERAALAQERAVLERELELVRRRSAEMAEELAHQSRHMAEERGVWSDELKEIRRLLEAMAQQRPEPSPPTYQAPISPRADDVRPITSPKGAEPAADDPVLDSVMAEFEILQKDLARRRKHSPDAGPEAAEAPLEVRS